MDNTIRGTSTSVPSTTHQTRTEHEKTLSKNPGETTVIDVTQSKEALDNLKQRVEASSGMDLDKINALKERIHQGQYQVDTEKLAEQLIRTESAFINNKD